MTDFINSSQTTDLVLWSVAWSPDGSYLAAGSGDGYIHVWQLDSLEEIIELKAHDNYVTFVAWSPWEDRLVSAGADGKARVWKITPDNMLLSLPYGFISNGDWSPDGKSFLVSTALDPEKKDRGVVALWDLSTGKPVYEISGNENGTFSWNKSVLPRMANILRL